jgi:hypothetical protein
VKRTVSCKSAHVKWRLYLCCSYSETGWAMSRFSSVVHPNDETVHWFGSISSFQILSNSSVINHTTIRLLEVLQGFVKNIRKRDTATNTVIRSYLEKFIVAQLFKIITRKSPRLKNTYHRSLSWTNGIQSIPVTPWRIVSIGMWHRVVWQMFSDDSEERATSTLNVYHEDGGITSPLNHQ